MGTRKLIDMHGILPILPPDGATRRYSRSTMDETPRLHIDSDWKAQAQAEKERLAERESARATRPGAEGEGELPPADFRTLIATLASQAMMGLGAYGDPQTGRVVIDVVGAQFAIDLLGVVEEKTKGNLSEEEATELKEVLTHLRARFVQIAKLVAAQMQREATGEGVAGSIGLGGISGGAQSPAVAPPTSQASRTTPSGLVIPD